MDYVRPHFHALLDFSDSRVDFAMDFDTFKHLYLSICAQQDRCKIFKQFADNYRDIYNSMI